MILSSLFCALTLLAPQDGARVSVVEAGRKTQTPLRFAWQEVTNATYLLSVAPSNAVPQLFAVSNRIDAYVTNFELGRCYVWSVRQAGAFDVASAAFQTDDKPPRLLFAHGVKNLRDLGGWRTDSGRRVRQNMIFRSAALSDRVPVAGIETLRSEFGIRTELDLRPLRDVLTQRGSALGSDVAWKNVTLEAGRRIDGVIGGREAFARIFSLLLERKNYPILVECSDGCARSGVLSFLLNGLLGVSDEDLRRDWTAGQPALNELTDHLKTLPGATWKERIVAYARGCGIADAEIDAFRSLMLE